MHFLSVCCDIICPEMKKHSNSRMWACFVYSTNLKSCWKSTKSTSCTIFKFSGLSVVPHVGQYPKACLLCPLICYTPDLLRCYSLCCTCFLQSVDFPHLFSGSFGNLLIFVLQCIHLPEGPVAHGQWFWGRDRMSCWRAGVLVLVPWHGHRQQPVALLLSSQYAFSLLQPGTVPLWTAA